MSDSRSAPLDYERCFHQLPGLFLVLTPDLHIVAASDAYLAATLTRREAIVGRYLFDVFPDNPDDPRADATRQTMESMRRVLRDREPDVMMVQRHDVRRPDAEGGGFVERYWSPVNSPVLGPDGEVQYIIHRVKNVTDYMLLQRERMQQQQERIDGVQHRMLMAEAELYSRTRDVAETNLELKSDVQSLARQFRATFEQAAVGLAHVGLQGEWLRVNGTLCRFLDYSASELQALTFQAITHPHDLDNDVAHMERLLRGEIESYTIEKRYRQRDGQYLWAELTAAIVRNEHLEPEYFISVIADIGARKAAEEALQRTNRRMEHFLAVLAHELRNPLAPIRNAVAMLGMTLDPVSPVVQQALPMMERQLAHMTHLLDDLLDASRITHDRIELAREPVDVGTAVDTLVETMRPQHAARGHTIQLTRPLESLTVSADPVRLTQIVSNLLDNADKFSLPNGRIWLDILREGDQVLLRVRDEGIGLAPDHLQTIFEPFSQVERARGHVQGGLGIGLSLVRSFAQMQDGTVEAHSEGLGRGSTFTVRLPLIERTATAAPHAPATTDMGSLRVLVVDDAPDAARSLADLVGILGNDAHAVNGGADALAVAPAFHPHLVLLDLGMPGMDGFETCRRLRQLPGGDRVQIVAVTGWGREEDRERTTSAGFDQHIVKPIAPDALRHLLTSVRVSAAH